MEDKMAMRLELVNNNIEIYKKNVIKEIEKENMIPATSFLLMLRDLKEQQLLLKELLKVGG